MKWFDVVQGATRYWFDEVQGATRWTDLMWSKGQRDELIWWGPRGDEMNWFWCGPSGNEMKWSTLGGGAECQRHTRLKMAWRRYHSWSPLVAYSFSSFSYTACPQKNTANYFLAQHHQTATKRSNLWHSDLRDNCECVCDCVFHLTCVMPIPGKTYQTS